MRFFYWRSANRGSPAETCYLISGRSGDGILSGSPKISHCSSPKSPGGHITTSEGLSSARSAAGNLTAQSLNIHLMMADFMKTPFTDNTFDAIYAIEATCHAPDALGCYKEIYRVLKPGQCFAAYEWCMTDSFDPKNKDHQRIKAEVEIGDGLPDIRSTRQCLEALKLAGFEVIWEKDLAADSPVPWYLPLDTSHFSLSSFRLTSVGRFITKNMVKALEFLGLAPEGSQRVSSFLEKAAEGLVEGGKKEIFTPMYFFLARKPHTDADNPSLATVEVN